MSDLPISVSAENLGKRYRIYPDSWSRVLEAVTFGRVRRHEEKWALRGVSFEVPRGAALGIVGANGAGKSTLLKVVTGVTPPTTGTFRIVGRVGSLLELGMGFHPDFSGKDNVFMNAAIMGIPRAEVRERFEELADFAELGDYLYRPVRTYSSGMAMRLGFAVAMMIKPDVLVLDEVLAVGDQHFQKKCMDRISEIRQAGTTILFVSHSSYHVRQICDRAIWIHDGVKVMEGDPGTVVDEYTNFQYALGSGQEALVAQKTDQPSLTALPHLGTIKICRAGEDEAREVFQTGDEIDIHVEYRNPTGDGTYHVGVICSRNDGLQVWGTRSKEHGLAFEGERASLVVRVPLKLTAGEFYISGYLLDESCDHVMDQRLAWARFKVRHDGIERGLVLPEARWLTPAEAR